MEETDAKPGTLKLFQRGIGKLFLVAAGMGALVLVIFVAQPMLTAPAPETAPLALEEIVTEVLREPPAEEGVEPRLTEDVQPEDLPAMPTPLMAVRREGEEVPVVFPAAEEPAAGEEAGPSDSLPPVLSAEEIEEAVSIPAPAGGSQAEGEPEADKPDEVREPATTMAAQESVGAGPIRDTDFQGWDGGIPAPPTLPPPEATREVQKLLESLGYEPGPADGIWGERTDRAWKNFAGDASHMDAGTGPDQGPLPTSDPAGAPARPEEPAAPSGGIGAGMAQGARQDERKRVPGTLRGVMGYRLPLVSRQEVPDQIVSGVLIPAHTTFVILRGGEWELVDLAPDEVKRLKDAAEAAAAPPETEPPPVRRSWNPLRLFRRQTPHQGGK